MSRISQLQELLKTEPGDSFLNYALALEYAGSRKKQEAIVLLEKLISADENYLAAYYQLAQFLEENKETEKARIVYAKGIEIARVQANTKTLSELQSALDNLE